MSDPPLQFCSVCGKSGYRKIPSLFTTDLKNFNKPIEMYSVACSTLQEVREIQVKCPDVQINDDPNSEMFGIPIAANRKQKKQVLRAVGFEERN